MSGRLPDCNPSTYEASPPGTATGGSHLGAPWGLNYATVPYTNYPANSIRAARRNGAFLLTSFMYVTNFLPVMPPE